MFFGRFLPSLSRIRRSHAMLMRKFGPTALNFFLFVNFFWDALYKYICCISSLYIEKKYSENMAFVPTVKIQIYIEQKYGQIRSSILPRTGHWLPSLTYVSQSLLPVHNLLLSTDTCMRTNIQIVLGNCEIIPIISLNSNKYC